MNTLDIRIKYKFDTGEYPTFNNGLNRYSGSLTQEYAEWLERGNVRLRDQFKRDTSYDATYYKIKGGQYVLIYTKLYKEWLEEKYVILYTLSQNIKDTLEEFEYESY